MSEPSTKRRRLSPNQRQQEILDATYQLVLAAGISNLTMEKIAMEAGASKALLYSYFPNISGLLQQLYKRELGKLQAQQREVMESPHSFEDMVKQTASINRVNQNKRQLLIKRLEGDPSVRTAMSKADRRARTEVVKYLCDEITGSYDIPPNVAEEAVKLALRYDEQGPVGRQKNTIDRDEIWGAMMVGAMQELQKRFGTKNKN